MVFPHFRAPVTFSPCNAYCTHIHSPLYLPKSFYHLHITTILIIPLPLARNLANALQRPIPQLDRAELDHPRVKSQRRLDVVLRLAARVVAHHEVVALGVRLLVLVCFAWQVEDPPVLDAADCAAGLEDYGAGCFDNSVCVREEERDEEGVRKEGERTL